MVNKNIILELSVSGGEYGFASSIESALIASRHELEKLQETIDSVKSLQPKCDQQDYILSASFGALCGIFDIFLVGKPGESPLGNITDKWFEARIENFAKTCGWVKKNGDPGSSATKFLEKKFEIPYDQRGAGDAAGEVFDLTPSNHHFKSLGHNPTLLGLFYSILDQFKNESHFVSDSNLLSLERANDNFELHGNNILSKLFFGFVNWFGHLVSDVSGSSGSQGRGMGIPSPIWAWTNDLIVLTKKLHIPADELCRSINEMSVQIFNAGFDFRFQTTQLIPVFLTESTVRLCYSIRRMYQYFSMTNHGERSFKELWKVCEPFKNPTIKRMLTVAHGTFCLLDTSDAIARGFIKGAGTFNAKEFFLRFNIAEFGRFTISLFGEFKRAITLSNAKLEADYALQEKCIVENYISGLNELSDLYDDKDLLSFVNDFKLSDMYQQAFNKSNELAIKRKVPEEKRLASKSDIDCYFMGGKKDEKKEN